MKDNDCKKELRTQIIDAASVYSAQLAGKTFLYVSGSDSFEVSFPTGSFLHLTGVETRLRPNDFYSKAKSGKLSTGQFGFSKRHDYKNAKKKLSCLEKLPSLTNDIIAIIYDMKTQTMVYKIGLTNLNFTIGLVENIEHPELFVPMTLRVNDKAIDRSQSPESTIVDFIFVRDSSEKIYNTLLYGDPSAVIPQDIADIISPDFYI